MTETDWDAIKAAYALIERGMGNRLDGNGWKVYRVGTIVRIDIEERQ